MRYGRIKTPAGEVVDAVFDDDGAARDGARAWPVEQVRLLPPVRPSKLIYVGMNYKDHAAELDAELPPEPLLFFKPVSALIGPEEPIVLPTESRRVDYEGELAVVIGEQARGLREPEALEAIAGYTIANDVTARDFQRPDTQWTKAKSWDTFAPLGPWIATELDHDDVVVETRLNGETRQRSSTANLCFGVAELVAFASRIMTLLPGDVLATGTPYGVGPMQPGDHIEVRIEGIGALRNPVLAEPAMSDTLGR